MIRKANECELSLRENMRGGNGTVRITSFATPDELYNKGRMFAKIVLEPGCGIGFHVHEKDSELFYLAKGSALYSDNGTLVEVSEGDVMLCPAGTGHSVTNNSDETAELIAVIVYA